MEIFFVRLSFLLDYMAYGAICLYILQLLSFFLSRNKLPDMRVAEMKHTAEVMLLPTLLGTLWVVTKLFIP